MVKLESEVFLLGHWKNFEELEENLTIDELQAILDAINDREERDRIFRAAIAGVDYKGGTREKDNSDPVERAKAKARAQLKGMSEDQIEWGDLGFEVEEI